MKHVIGIDLGTSAVKLLLVNEAGEVVEEISKEYPVIQERTGYSEQNPDVWVDQTVSGLSDLLNQFDGDPADIEGLSFSGQMHGLVLLDQHQAVLRNAILWNDTRTTAECQQIHDLIGKERLLSITKNVALEGFTLPKLLWVKNNEEELFQQAATFVLPKDYVRLKLTGKLGMDYSDAAGTLLLDIEANNWSSDICEQLNIPYDLCPPLLESHQEVGTITPELAKATGLSEHTRVFAGGADNACGAIGAGILEEGKAMVSIGTSGVVLTYEELGDQDFGGAVHYFNHGAPDAYYTMGVTLAAGNSLSWFRNVFASNQSFDGLIAEAATVPAGCDGLLFTPYITGERTPHGDASIRGSFIGMDISHQRQHFVRAVLEGITFSLHETIEIFRGNGKNIHTIISIGGGAKSDLWLQMQADIFNAKIVKLASEQGPGMGAAMLAAYGCGWFATLNECSEKFLKEERTYYPDNINAERYKELFALYTDIYSATASLNNKLMAYRQ